MELYEIDNKIVVNKDNKCLNIKDDYNFNIWINGDSNKKLNGNSFKITEYDRKLYYIFREFYILLVDYYNMYKEFHDFEFEEYPLYDEKHNWFTFYDDYSSVEDGNFFRIIKNEKKEPYTIGIYIRNKNNRLQSHTFAKSGSRYSHFGPCFSKLTKDLKKLKIENAHIKKKEV